MTLIINRDNFDFQESFVDSVVHTKGSQLLIGKLDNCGLNPIKVLLTHSAFFDDILTLNITSTSAPGVLYPNVLKKGDPIYIDNPNATHVVFYIAQDVPINFPIATGVLNIPVLFESEPFNIFFGSFIYNNLIFDLSQGISETTTSLEVFVSGSVNGGINLREGQLLYVKTAPDSIINLNRAYIELTDNVTINPGQAKEVRTQIRSTRDIDLSSGDITFEAFALESIGLIQSMSFSESNTIVEKDTYDRNFYPLFGKTASNKTLNVNFITEWNNKALGLISEADSENIYFYLQEGSDSNWQYRTFGTASVSSFNRDLNVKDFLKGNLSLQLSRSVTIHRKQILTPEQKMAYEEACRLVGVKF
jgi:hypothetical protein